MTSLRRDHPEHVREIDLARVRAFVANYLAPDPGCCCLACGAKGFTLNAELCDGCWLALPAETRRRLRLLDADARNRRFQLLSALRRGVVLAEITVSA